MPLGQHHRGHHEVAVGLEQRWTPRWRVQVVQGRRVEDASRHSAGLALAGQCTTDVLGEGALGASMEASQEVMKSSA